MEFETTRFGTMEVEEQDIITLQEGLYGFPLLRQFVVVQHKENSPYKWMQSLEEKSLAFLITDPWNFKPDYAPMVSDNDADALGITAVNEKIVYTIVTIPPGNPQGMTMNLAGPVVINPETRMARQIVVEGDQYHTRHSIVEEMRSFAPQAAAH